MKYRMKSVMDKTGKYFFMGFILFLFLFIGIVIGVKLGTKWSYNMEERQNQAQLFHYGVVENDITVTDIEWQEFPNWRNVSCIVQGSFSVNIPKDADITFADLANTDSIKETTREHQVFSDGKELIYYDYVTYEVESGLLEVTGLLKEKDNEIVAATKGYKVSLTWENGEYFLGYISPLSEVFEVWTDQQNEFAGQNITPYLNTFALSRTYVDTNILCSISVADNMKLSKREGGLLDCTLKNEGTVDWTYSTELPALEMWYKGVWIELKTKWDNALIVKNCPGMKQEEMVFPEEITDAYPDLFPGLYRLVIYGTEGDCAISETFLINEE